MKNTNKIFALLLALVMLLSMLASCGDNTQGENGGGGGDETKTAVGSDIGNLVTYYSLEREGSEEKFNVKDYKGKVIVVNFWGTWCTPCKNELPEFSEFATDYKDKNVIVVAIHSNQGRAYAPAYIAENYPDSDLIFAYDVPRTNKTDMYFNKLGGTDYYPYTVIIDEEGIIQFKHNGMMSYEALKSVVDEVLSK